MLAVRVVLYFALAKYVFSSCCKSFPGSCTCRFDMLIDCAGQGLTEIPHFKNNSACIRFRYLSLKDNFIRCPSIDYLANLPHLKNIDLSGNPLNCTCLNLFANFAIRKPKHCSEISTTSSPTVTKTMLSTVDRTPTISSLLYSSTQMSTSTTGLVSLSTIPATTYHSQVMDRTPTISSLYTSTQMSTLTTGLISSSTIPPTTYHSKVNTMNTNLSDRSNTRQTFQWVLESSIAVPVAFVAIGIVIVILKNVSKFRKVFTPRNDDVMEMGDINQGVDNGSDDEVIVYSAVRIQRQDESSL